MPSSVSCYKWFWRSWVVLLTIYSCSNIHQDLYLYYFLSLINCVPQYLHCEPMFLLPCDTQFHIFHQQFCFFHLLAHSSCIITKTFQLFLKPSKETSLNFPSLCLSYHDWQELLFFPWCSTFYSAVYFYPLLYPSYFAISVYLRKVFISHTQLNPRRLLAQLLAQWSPSVQRNSCSMNASWWSDILKLSSQHFSLNHLFIFVVLPCLCPPPLGTQRLPLNVMHMEISLPPGRKKISSTLWMLYHLKMKPCLQWRI